MKAYRIFIAITALSALCFWAGATLAQEHAHEQAAAEQQEATEAQAPGETALKEMEGNICLVMGGPINKKYNYVHTETVYYFCSSGCIEKFKADPDKYIEKLAGT